MTMKRGASVQVGRLLAGATLILGANIVMAATARQDRPNTAQEPAALSDAELAKVGEETVTSACANQCHGFENLEARRTVGEWNTIVREMVDRGARATEKELAIVRQYLKRHYGVVAVNTAPAEELSAVLGLSPKDAQSIVDYRTAHGKFADADALRKVPGIDSTKIDEQPQALRFK